MIVALPSPSRATLIGKVAVLVELEAVEQAVVHETELGVVARGVHRAVVDDDVTRVLGLVLGDQRLGLVLGLLQRRLGRPFDDFVEEPFDLHVPLCRQSLEILEQCRERNREDTWVFPAVRKDLNKTGHVRLMSADLQLKTGLPITVQGLRRSFVTMARQLELCEDGERLTNHVNDSLSGKKYRQTDVDALRQPLQLIADEIERLMKEGSAL